MKRMMAGAALSMALAIVGSYGTARADTFGSGSNTFTIDFVTVGNPGNSNDQFPGGPYGGVDYTYRIGANAVSMDMILKASSEGNLGIVPFDFDAFGIGVGKGNNRPATGISWNQAARFVNWLNTSNGYSPAYKFTSQPGDAGYNSNENIQLWAVTDSGYNPDNQYRNSNAYYFLPSEDEWYKAAYYNGIDDSYYLYATQQNTAPTAVSEGSSGAVYDQDYFTGPAAVDNAGTASHYGTIGQNGNASEWMESAFDGTDDDPAANRVFRGSYWEFEFASNMES